MNDAENAQSLDVDYHVEDRAVIDANDNSLWIYDYKEVMPPRKQFEGSFQQLGNHIQPSGIKMLKPSDYPEKCSRFWA